MHRLTKSLFLLILAPSLLGLGTLGFSVPAKAEALPLPNRTLYTPKANEFVSAVVMDPTTKRILYQFEADKPHAAASLTKLPNALAFSSLPSVSWNKSVNLVQADEVGGGRLRVAVGTKLTIQDMFYSTIAASANNTATALARLSGLSFKAYLERMNKEAKAAGAVNSTFVDASGMDARNMTTARDMALITLQAFRNRTLQKAASTMQYAFSVTEPKKSPVKKVITNTNTLLTHDPDVYVLGGKTGYLEEAQYNLTVQMRPFGADGQPERQKELIVVVLGAPTKEGSFASAKKLAQWAWKNHEFGSPSVTAARTP